MGHYVKWQVSGKNHLHYFKLTNLLNVIHDKNWSSCSEVNTSWESEFVIGVTNLQKFQTQTLPEVQRRDWFLDLQGAIGHSFIWTEDSAADKHEDHYLQSCFEDTDRKRFN